MFFSWKTRHVHSPAARRSIKYSCPLTFRLPLPRIPLELPPLLSRSNKRRPCLPLNQHASHTILGFTVLKAVRRSSSVLKETLVCSFGSPLRRQSNQRALSRRRKIWLHLRRPRAVGLSQQSIERRGDLVFEEAA